MALLAMCALLQGAVNWWISGVAEQRVQRGRIAADLHAGFIELQGAKQQLKAWTLQVLLGTVPPPADGARLSSLLIQRTDELQALGLQAERFDRLPAATASEHAARQAALTELRSAFVRLREAVLRMDAVSPVNEPQVAWRALERIFDVAGDVNLGALVQSAVDRETQSLAQKRAAADQLLTRLRVLSSLATGVIVALAMAFALGLARSLRRPLADMAHGAEALRQGDLDHRIPVRAADEFGMLAAGVNRMAEELAMRRREEATARERLAGEVADRTRDLQDAVDALQLSEARRRRLIADISHELRTPTAAIRGEAEIAMRGGAKTPDAYRDALTRIVEAAEQLGDVINDLLTIARSDADALTVEMAEIDMADVVRSAASRMQGAAAARGIDIRPAPMDGPVPVMGDAQRLRQVLGLLLDNAIRYSHPGGRVALSLAVEPGDTVVLSVSDGGIGIAPEDIERIFERQHRGGNARQHRPEGAGLGLAIARDLLARHDGSIVALPQAEGALFEIRLPLARSHKEVAS